MLTKIRLVACMIRRIVLLQTQQPFISYAINQMCTGPVYGCRKSPPLHDFNKSATLCSHLIWWSYCMIGMVCTGVPDIILRRASV